MKVAIVSAASELVQLAQPTHQNNAN